MPPRPRPCSLLESSIVAVMAALGLFTFLWVFFRLALAQSNSSATYTNPILSSGADPWVVRYEDYYYMTYSTNDNITILRSSVLTDFENADVKLAFDPPAGYNYSTDLWAPVSRSPTSTCTSKRHRA